MRWFFHDFNDPRFRYSRICTRRKHSGFIHITLFSSPIESVLAHFHWFVCRNHWYSMAHNLSMNQYKCLNNAYDRCVFAFRSSYMCASLVMCSSFQRFNCICKYSTLGIYLLCYMPVGHLYLFSMSSAKKKTAGFTVPTCWRQRAKNPSSVPWACDFAC